MEIEMEKSTLQARPDTRDLTSHTLRRDEEGPRVTWVAIFDYPDCVREYDGVKWTVTPKQP